MKKLILLAGPAKSGKTSFCSYLMERLDNAKRIEMSGEGATGLKGAVGKMLGRDSEWVDKNKDKGSLFFTEDLLFMIKQVKVHLAEGNMRPDEVPAALNSIYSVILEDSITPRRLLQLFGEEIAKDIGGKYVWMCERLREIRKIQDNYEYIFIGGIRLHSEVKFFQEAFGEDCITIRLNRLNEDGSMFCDLQEGDREHITEQEARTIEGDFRMDAKNLEELHAQAEDFYKFLLK